MGEFFHSPPPPLHCRVETLLASTSIPLGASNDRKFSRSHYSMTLNFLRLLPTFHIFCTRGSRTTKNCRTGRIQTSRPRRCSAKKGLRGKSPEYPQPPPFLIPGAPCPLPSKAAGSIRCTHCTCSEGPQIPQQSYLEVFCVGSSSTRFLLLTLTHGWLPLPARP